MRFHSVLRVPSPRLSAFALAASLVVIASACSDDKSTAPVPEPEDPRKTIAGTMQELIDAYEARDIARYSKLFDADSFRFVFDPSDVQDDPDLPVSWDWTDEKSANETMFASPLVERIVLDFVIGAPAEPSEQDIGERTFPEGTRKVIVTDVALDVDTRDPTGGENIVYRVIGDHAIFFLYPDQTKLVDGVPVWKIFEWRDKKIGAFATIENSWGRVKATYL